MRILALKLGDNDTGVSDSINIIKTTFLFKFFQSTSLQVMKEKLLKLTASLCFHIFVYKSKFNSKVVFIILI